MNIQNFKKLRDYFATVKPENVSMSDWYADAIPDEEGYTNNYAEACAIPDGVDFTGANCGTTACLAGHCQYKFAEGDERTEFADTFATAWLGLTPYDAQQLFCQASLYGVEPSIDNDFDPRLYEVTHEMVLAKLDEIILTGEIEE